MSLINSTYFNGNLQVAQVQQKAVSDSLQIFIDRYEPEFLELVLGVDLYAAFVAGLAESVIADKWLFLRDGGNFVGYNTYTHKWVGLAGTTGSTGSGSAANQQEVQVPVGSYAGTNTLTYAALAGATYWVERRGFGTMIESVDITISNNGQTWTLLKAGDVFAVNEIFIAHITKFAAGSPSASIQPSPIAAYVYYHYMRDLQTQSMGAGETKAQSQNAISVSAAQKMVDAWNIMCKQLQQLFEYLNINNDSYPGWDYGARVNWYALGYSYDCWYGGNAEFRTINTIGI